MANFHMWIARFSLVLLSPFAAASTTVMVDLRPGLSGTNFGQGFLRGSTGKVDVYMENCPGQFCDGTNVTSVYLHLPPGLSYLSHVGYRPTFLACTAETVAPAGQVVRCTGAGLSGNPNSINKYSGITFDVAVAVDAPLGPAPIHVGLDEQSPAGSQTLVQCMGDTAPIWCDVMNLPILAQPTPELVFEGGGYSGAGLVIGDETGTVTANFRNIGTAATTRINIQIQLPRGVYWRSAANASSPGSFNCSSSGSVDPGYVLTCSSATALNAGAAGFLRIGVNPGVLTQGMAPVLYSIDALSTPALQGLPECAANPERADCLLLEVPLRNGCEGRHGMDGIFCNGYESSAH